MRNLVCVFIAIVFLNSFLWATNNVTELEASYKNLAGNLDTVSSFYALSHKYNKKWDYELELYYESKTEAQAKQYNCANLLETRFGKSITNQWYYFLGYTDSRNDLIYLTSRSGFSYGSGYWFFDLPETSLAAEFSYGNFKEIYEQELPEHTRYIKFRESLVQAITNTISIKNELNYYWFSENYEYNYNISLITQWAENLSYKLSYRYSYKDEVVLDASRWDSEVMFSFLAVFR